MQQRLGTEFSSAQTTFPSDSFPGMVAQLTGGGPGTTGVYYDDTYNHALLPPGTIDCANTAPGTEVSWTEAADKSQNPITLDAGQRITDPALTNLPNQSKATTLANASAITAAILKMTPTPQSLLDPATLPVSPTSCTPLYPHQYLRVNTVFNVVRAAGMRTAWSDKHPAYEILNGPSGNGVEDLFTPEINSAADSTGDDWTTDNALTMEYDSIKVAAIVNEIDGYDHSRTHRVGMPAILGMNFQTVSTAQKLPTSDGLWGGYNPNGTPGPLVERALDYLNQQLGRMISELRATGHARDTAIILSAKHGQSPIDPHLLRRVDDGAILDALNKAWVAAGGSGAVPLVSFSVDDDGMLVWLSDHPGGAGIRQALPDVALCAGEHDQRPEGRVLHHRCLLRSERRLHRCRSGRAVRRRPGDTHAPDLVGIAQHGVVYTGGVKKIAEHGGAAADDRHVPLVVSGAGVDAGRIDSKPVLTTQIAPTILRLLGLNPENLQAVRTEHTKALPLR